MSTTAPTHWIPGRAVRRLAVLATAATLVASIFAGPATVLAASPANDNFADAGVIAALPFSATADITAATAEPGEPQSCYNMSTTVWYAFTPTMNGAVRVDTAGSSFFDSNVNVYTAAGPGFGGLAFRGCSSFGNAQVFTVQATTTYYLQGGSAFGGGTGLLHLNVTPIPPPPNDNFAQAVTIASLPFSADVDTSAATPEATEPFPSCGILAATAWYAFTPTVSETVTATAPAPFGVRMAVYKGSALSSLTEVACRDGQVSVHLDAGTTYYFQVAGIFGQAGPMNFQLAVTPPPVAQFGFNPFDPSIFDTVQFSDFSFDPGNVGFSPQAWLFGDGTSANGCCPRHTFARDGDYTVQLNVITVDGRTASTSQVVHVQTHDVAITKFDVPNAAASGKSKQIVVGVNSKRYTETVQVQLSKSTPTGFVVLGTFTQSVQMRPNKRTTDFAFTYVFTLDDAAVGKVTFKADATIVGPRDALPGDNQVIALPMKVRK